MSDLLVSYLAGWLITLSPCVLPVLPMMLGGVASQNRYAPLLMAIGLTSSFALAGTLIAATGAASGTAPEVLRHLAAGLLLLTGLLILFPKPAYAFSQLFSRPASFANNLSGRVMNAGMLGQVLAGALLGLVWAPCSGPALVAALGLAAGATSASDGFIRLFCFGLGASTPLLLVAYFARGVFMRFNPAALQKLRAGFGILLLCVGALILSGQDLVLQEWVLQRLPVSLIKFSVSL